MPQASRILAFGDSITYGFGVRPRESYPSLLSGLTGCTVTNAGINGETSEEGRVRLPQVLQNASFDIMVLCMGANDILQGRPLARLEANLGRMIETAQTAGARVVLIGVASFDPVDVTPLPLYEAAARRYAVDYLPDPLCNVLSNGALHTDGVHPNAAGYRRLAEEIALYLTEKEYISS